MPAPANIDLIYGQRHASSVSALALGLDPGEIGLCTADNSVWMMDYLGTLFLVRARTFNLGEFGAVGDGVADDGAAINAASAAAAAAGGGELVGVPGKTYAVNPGANRVRLKSNTGINLNGSTIQRIGTDYTQNLIENFTYAPGTSYDANIWVRNGTVKGNVTNSTGTQSHASPCANVYFFGVNGFRLQDLKLDTANGDCLGWRLSNSGFVDRVVGGSFGRNLFSPTSGVGNRITNCNFAFLGATGASPGEYIDIESDGETGFVERSETYWENVTSYGITMLDPYSDPTHTYVELTAASFSASPVPGDIGKVIVGASTGATGVLKSYDVPTKLLRITQTTGTAFSAVEGFTITAGTGAGTLASTLAWPDQSFSHEAQFSNFKLLGNSPQTFRVIATNSVVAKNIQVGNTCIIGVLSNSASAVSVGNVAGIQIAAKLINNSGSAGTTRAIVLTGPTDNFIFKGSISSGSQAFANGVVATSYPLTNSSFSNADLGASNLYVGSNSNRFIGCPMSSLVLSASSSNFFPGCQITAVTVNGSSNDFSSARIGSVVVDGAGSINNRFGIDTVITGSKTFTNSATWLAQLFEKEEGSFTPTITGASSGSATLSTAWGRYNILGDMCFFSASIQWTASTGVGAQKINLNLPNAIVPVDGSTPSRWSVSLAGYSFAFTGTMLEGTISGGNGFISLFGVDNTGTATSVPASLATGRIDGISGFFRIR